MVPKWHRLTAGEDSMASDTSTLERNRITARVSKDVREKLEQAANSSGATLNQFVVQAAVEKAEQILERERVTRLSARDAEWMLNLLDQPPRSPNSKLQRALENYDKATRGDSNSAFDRPTRPDDV
jgi:uncharacterized protein (DUF1778 family)